VAVNRRPKLTIVAPDASPEEAAAVVAALERFMRETTPATARPLPQIDPWQRAALNEGIARDPQQHHFQGLLASMWSQSW
jgi:hypothetical protein